MLHVSTQTLRRRKNELGIDDNFSVISEEGLTRIMEEIIKVTPNISQSRMVGALRARGLNIQRHRVKCHMSSSANGMATQSVQLRTLVQSNFSLDEQCPIVIGIYLKE